MTITTARNRTAGLRMFYVSSESHPERASYVVPHIERAGMSGWACSCLDLICRGEIRRSHRFCKHIRVVRELPKSAASLQGKPFVPRDLGKLAEECLKPTAQPLPALKGKE